MNEDRLMAAALQAALQGDDVTDLDNASKGGDNAECCYARRESVEVGSQCYGCGLFKNDDDSPECSYLAYADIAARIRKLRGDGE